MIADSFLLGQRRLTARALLTWFSKTPVHTAVGLTSLSTHQAHLRDQNIGLALNNRERGDAGGWAPVEIDVRLALNARETLSFIDTLRFGLDSDGVRL